jgi:hypothetical protein
MYLEQRMQIIVRRGLIGIAGLVWFGLMAGTAYAVIHFVVKYW